ncbi:UNVERIFIED_CONTAM: hypothetical protein RMT77_002164 [Armadillidium vulgare]
MKILLQVTLVALVICFAAATPTGYDAPKGYFQYVNVPGIKEYEFGFNRGNPHHWISRFEQAKDHRFRTRVKWGDTHDGHGEHYWEYNHAPKGGYHEPIKGDGYGHEPVGYGHEPVVGYEHEQPLGYHSENIDVIVPAKH